MIEWLRFLPFIQALKQVRNDYWLHRFVQTPVKHLPTFLKTHQHFAHKNIAIVIAFEQPWALNFLLEMAQKNLMDTQIIVCDNSKKISARTEIEAICQKNKISYLALPNNITRHVNRSHGLAMSWAYENIVKPLKPRLFAFFDHDLIPVSPIYLEERLNAQDFFGQRNKGKYGYWSLWAGYCIFNYAKVKDKKLNFLYDFSRDLDTGGRNWETLYKHYDPQHLRFSNHVKQSFQLPDIAIQELVEIVDDRWIHISGISYNDNFKPKFEFYQALSLLLKKGYDWPEISTIKTST
jgi:hypothetical protein